jgi:hypothetical protein
MWKMLTLVCGLCYIGFIHLVVVVVVVVVVAVAAAAAAAAAGVWRQKLALSIGPN